MPAKFDKKHGNKVGIRKEISSPILQPGSEIPFSRWSATVDVRSSNRVEPVQPGWSPPTRLRYNHHTGLTIKERRNCQKALSLNADPLEYLPRSESSPSASPSGESNTNRLSHSQRSDDETEISTHSIDKAANNPSLLATNDKDKSVVPISGDELEIVERWTTSAAESSGAPNTSLENSGSDNDHQKIEKHSPVPLYYALKSKNKIWKTISQSEFGKKQGRTELQRRKDKQKAAFRRRAFKANQSSSSGALAFQGSLSESLSDPRPRLATYCGDLPEGSNHLSLLSFKIGYLYVLDGADYKRRHFRLSEDDGLKIYKSEQDKSTSHIEEIHLDFLRCELLVNTPDAKKKDPRYYFCLRSDDLTAKCWFLAAESEEERKLWMVSITWHIENRCKLPVTEMSDLTRKYLEPFIPKYEQDESDASSSDSCQESESDAEVEVDPVRVERRPKRAGRLSGYRYHSFDEIKEDIATSNISNTDVGKPPFFDITKNDDNDISPIAPELKKNIHFISELKEKRSQAADGRPIPSQLHDSDMVENTYMDVSPNSLLSPLPNSSRFEAPALPISKSPTLVHPQRPKAHSLPPAFIFNLKPKSDKGKAIKAKSAMDQSKVPLTAPPFLHFPNYGPIFSDREHQTLKFSSSNVEKEKTDPLGCLKAYNEQVQGENNKISPLNSMHDSDKGVDLDEAEDNTSFNLQTTKLASPAIPEGEHEEDIYLNESDLEENASLSSSSEYYESEEDACADGFSPRRISSSSLLEAPALPISKPPPLSLRRKSKPHLAIDLEEKASLSSESDSVYYESEEDACADGIPRGISSTSLSDVPPLPISKPPPLPARKKGKAPLAALPSLQALLPHPATLLLQPSLAGQGGSVAEITVPEEVSNRSSPPSRAQPEVPPRPQTQRPPLPPPHDIPPWPYNL